MMEPAHEAPPNAAAAVPPSPDPFTDIRARTVVWWVVAWFLSMIVCATLGGRIELLVYTLYPVLLGWVAYETGHHGLCIQDFIRRPAFDAFRRLWLLLPSLGFSFACVIITIALLHVTPSALHDRSAELALRRGTSRVDSAITVAGMVIAAPFAEELVFRGIILHRWAHKWGFVRGALASSAAFALLHPDPLGAFVFALIMVHLYTWSGTLLVPMTAHALNNVIVVLAMSGSAGSPDTVSSAAADASEVARAVPGAVVLGVVGLLALGLYFRGVPRMSEWRLPSIAARRRRDDVIPAR